MSGGSTGVGGRIVISGDELRRLSTIVDGVVPPVDGAVERIGGVIAGLDRRGWNAAPVDSQWTTIRSEWVCLRGSLIPTSRDLFRRGLLADRLNVWQGIDLGPPVYGPYLPGRGPYPLPPVCVDLGYAPWLTPEQWSLLASQGLAALDRIPFGAMGVDPPPPPPPPRPPPPQAPEEQDRSWWETGLDWTQGGLDVVGLVPGFGEIADGANGLIYLGRGDYVNAGLSGASMIPFAGWGATATKWGRRGLEYGDEVAAGVRHGDEVVDAAGTVTRRLDDAGRFVDPNVEAQYQRYLAKKQAAGQAPRTREGWHDRVEYFQNSGVGRGTTFNEVRRESYPYNEVHLSNGKRLDSYVPGEEIVSRKATDFDNIEDGTFRQYLNEVTRKYDVGTTIRSNKYPALDGKQLDGTLVLEVPDSNLTSASRQHFEKMARDAGIEIRYAPEGP